MPEDDPFATAETFLRDRAMKYPEATEEFPWGDRTIKVRGKIFVFLGAGKDGFGMSAKLPATHELALTRKGTRPTPYGLGAGMRGNGKSVSGGRMSPLRSWSGAPKTHSSHTCSSKGPPPFTR